MKLCKFGISFLIANSLTFAYSTTRDELSTLKMQMAKMQQAMLKLQSKIEKSETKTIKSDTQGFKFNGELRFRYNMFEDDAPAGNTTDHSDTKTDYRMRLGISKAFDRGDMFLQLQQRDTFGSRDGNLATESSKGFDLHQAWFNLHLDDEKKNTVKLGRMMTKFGSGRVLGWRNWNSVGQVFDGVLFKNRSKSNFDFDAFYFKVDRDPTAFVAPVPATSDERDLFGANLYWKDVFDGKLMGYLYQRNTQANNLVDSDRLSTYGLNYTKSVNKWKFNAEYAWQDGDATLAGVNTGYDGDMLIAKAMYTLSEDKENHSKRSIGVEYNAYSGNDAGASNSGWQPLYPNRHGFLGYADVFYQQNINDLIFHYESKINKRNSYKISFHNFELNDVNDAVYYRKKNYVATQGAAGNLEDDLGSEWNVKFTHKYSKDMKMTVGYNRFSSGDFYSNTANQTTGNTYSFDSEFTFVETTLKF